MRGPRRPHARGAASPEASPPGHTGRPALQISDEYSSLKGFTPRETGGNRGGPGEPSGKAAAAAAAAAADSKSATARLIDSIPVTRPGDAAAARAGTGGSQLVLHTGKEGITAAAKAALTSTIMVPTAAGGQREYTPSAVVARKIPNKWPRPAWHAPWKMYRVIAGHLG